MAFVYFEKQQNDLMCGLHCLNALVQRPLFTKEILAKIADELDKKTKELLGEFFEGNQGGGVGADG